MKEKERTEAYIHYIMSLSGGFMGAYALLNRCEIFGSAQTANMIHSILDLSSGSWTSLLLRLGSLLIFITAIIAATLIPRLISIDIRLICILAEIPVIAVLGFFRRTWTRSWLSIPYFSSWPFNGVPLPA